MISPTDETAVRSLLERAARPAPYAPVSLPGIAARARRRRTVRRAVRGVAGAGALAVVGLLARPVLPGGASTPDGVTPAAGGTQAAGHLLGLVLELGGPILIGLGMVGLAVLLVLAVLWRGAVARPRRWAAAGVAVVLIGGLTSGLTLRVYDQPSGSMESTLLIGDRVLVTTLSPGTFPLRRGDVVVFRDPGAWLQPGNGPTILLKRVIGLPGDTVECCDATGRLTVNGVPVTESYLHPGDRPSEETFSTKVPPGRLWVLGDHRSSSWDSRHNGAVPVASVVGRVDAVVWPFSRLHLLPGQEGA